MYDSVAQNSPLLLKILGILLLSVYHDNYFLYFIVASLILGTGGNVVMKSFFKKVLDKDSYLARRPDPNGICGIGNSEIPKDSIHNFGFPSGHMQSTTTSIVLLLFWVVFLSHFKKTTQNIIILLGIVFIIYVGWSRIHLGCHNIEQVSAGTLFGLIGGLIGIKLWLIY
jgi:membrane-associated phospholipid phosphatase